VCEAAHLLMVSRDSVFEWILTALEALVRRITFLHAKNYRREAVRSVK
jgi:hypothetical protein